MWSEWWAHSENLADHTADGHDHDTNDLNHFTMIKVVNCVTKNDWNSNTVIQRDLAMETDILMHIHDSSLNI